MIIRQKKQRYLFEENYYFIIHRLVRKWYWLVRCYVDLSNNNVNWKARIERGNVKCWMFEPLTTKEKKIVSKWGCLHCNVKKRSIVIEVLEKKIYLRVYLYPELWPPFGAFRIGLKIAIWTIYFLHTLRILA